MRPQIQPLTFADLELQQHDIPLDASLQALAEFLDAHAELVMLVHADLVRGLKRPRTGRSGLSATLVLRAFVLQRVKDWDLRELRERIADGYTLRRFTTFDGQPAPKHDAFHRAFSRLSPATVRSLYAADRGFYTPDNIAALTAAGVTRVVVPQRGGTKSADQTTYEKSASFKKGQRFRAGIEGRISVLMRGRGMRRCRLEGRERFEVFVGAAVLANNLLRIADLMRRRPRRYRRAA